MKTIYINEDFVKERLLKEESLSTEISSDLSKDIANNKTSLGKNPSLPDIYDDSYLLKICTDRLTDIVKKLKEVSSIDIVKSSDSRHALSELIGICAKKEKPNRERLEMIAYEIVSKMFKIPNGLVVFNIHLADEIQLNTDVVSIDKVHGDVEYNDIEEAESIIGEIDKRRLLNSICMGAGLSYSEDVDLYESLISEIDNDLPDVYRFIMLLNNYLLYTQDGIEITEDKNLQLGYSYVELGNGDNEVSITVEAKIFPVLLCELIRALMELFASHGLPDELETARFVMDRSDYLKAEPWDMRIGPVLWISLLESMGVIKTPMIPYIFSELAKFDIEDFNYTMKNVFAKTKKGKEIMSQLVAMSEDEMSDSVDAEPTVDDTDKSLISDDCIHNEEL